MSQETLVGFMEDKTLGLTIKNEDEILMEGKEAQGRRHFLSQARNFSQ